MILSQLDTRKISRNKKSYRSGGSMYDCIIKYDLLVTTAAFHNIETGGGIVIFV